ncbi:MAG: HDOD domain-containing protein, partial [Chloroflexi bacterium]|nr:HDOD domain-containing protein [Chloroflexota bacterium]
MVEAAVSAHVKRAAIPSGPMLPAARAGALSMMQDDDVRMDDLATLIRADPGLTLVLLRAANSAASASRRRIEDTRDALVRIGLQATKRVVAAAVVGEAFQNMDECGIDEDAFWAHSLATAVICESSVTTARLRPVAFSAGLLHDVGRLVLGASLPEVYGSLSDSARREPMVLGAEAAIFGEDHAKAGGRLLSLWGVSDEIAA